MANLLVEALRSNSKTGEFDANASIISYKTGFPVFDYYLGYKVFVYDKNDQIIDSYNCIGIAAGSFNTFIGKPSTSKTTTAVQVAANIVRPYENGFVIHYDLEQAQNYTRIQGLAKYPISKMQEGKYILRQESNGIDDIYKAIMKIYFEKMNNPDKYQYDTGKLNEFGEKIILFEPTVVIIDSIAAMSEAINENDSKDVKKISELEGQTYANRVARELSQFMTKLMPRLRAANIIVIAINQIKQKIDIGLSKSAAQIFYLDQDETLPGGQAPQFYAHTLTKFIAIGSEKSNMEEHGFDGFGVKAKIIKSRTNQAGQEFISIFDKQRGIDSERTTVRYAKDNGLLGGARRDSMYFVDNKDTKLSTINIHKSFNENPELYKIMYAHVIPSLEAKLSALLPEELSENEYLLDY